MSEEEKKAQEERMKKVEETIQKLADSQAKLGESFETVTDSILGITEKLDAKPKKSDKSSAGPSDRDLETMNRPEYTKHLLGEVGKLIETSVKPLEEGISAETTTRRQSNVAGQIKAAEGAHKDFWDWKDEMGVLAKLHTTLPVEDLYQMVRGRDATKAKELDEKHNPKKKSDEEESGFGGLFPTSGNLSSEELKKDMTSDEAADLAWEKTMKGVALPSD